MAILNGDLRNPSKKEQKARAAKFSERDNQKVMNLQARSQSGFKGEKTNERGLPTGPTETKRTKGRPRYDTYAKGTKSIHIDDPKIEKAEPRITSRPDISNLPKYEAPSMRLALSDAPAPISDAKRADMEKVRQYQTKLNKVGANLEVDGMWGEKTIAASRSLHSKTVTRKSSPSRQRPVSDADLNSKIDRMEERRSTPKTSDPLNTTSQTQTVDTSNGNTKKVMNFKLPEDSIRKKIAAGEAINGVRYKDYESFTGSYKNSSPAKSDSIPAIKQSTTLIADLDPLTRRRMDLKKKQDLDAQQRRDAREVDSMAGDADSGRVPLNRSQARKMVALEDREDDEMSAAGLVGVGMAGAVTTGLGIVAGRRIKKGRAIKAVNAARTTMRLASENSADAVIKRGGKAAPKVESFKFSGKTKNNSNEMNSADAVISRAKNRGEQIYTRDSSKEPMKLDRKKTKTKTSKSKSKTQPQHFDQSADGVIRRASRNTDKIYSGRKN